MNVTKQTAARIRMIRENRNIKQAVFASQMNISVQTLSSIENGKSEITLSKLEQFAAAFDLPVHELLGTFDFEDPIADRKLALENTTIHLLNMYSDLQNKQFNEIELMKQNQIIILLQQQILAKLESNHAVTIEP